MKTRILLLIAALLLLFPLHTQEVYETRGPNGERPERFGVVGFGGLERDRIAKKQLKAAILMHTSSDFSEAVITGAKERFKLLGVEVLYVSKAQFDASKQVADIEKAVSLDVDIIITLILDPESGGSALKKAADKGVKIALLSNLPNGFVHLRDYASIVTDDLYGMGKSLAEMMGDSLGGQGSAIWLYHDAEYYVTNQRDNAFRTSLKGLYPNIKIVAEKGISNPEDSQKVMTELLLKNPDIQAVYAPWDAIAEGVVAALKAAGRWDVKVFTMDLGREVSLEMAKEGFVHGIVADLPYTIGSTLASVACLSAVDRETPPFIIVPAIKVNRNNLEQMWLRAYRIKAPQDVIDALK